ncbi:MAG: hypothetical protein PVI06_17410 [Desulfobacterales bacterium]|jgi:hypothetical protein
MKDKGSLHQKVQEMCDCYTTTDPLKEMSVVKDEQDKQEAAIKWLALTALHGINNNAKEISLTRSRDGGVKVTAQYRKSELPTPGPEVGNKIFETIRGITHIEKDYGEMSLALGIRDSSLDLKVKLTPKDNGEEVTISFPE